MRINVGGDDNLMLASDIEVSGPDRDGFFAAGMTLNGRSLRALSRNAFAAVGYLFDLAGAQLLAEARQRKEEALLLEEMHRQAMEKILTAFQVPAVEPPAQRDFPSRNYGTGFQEKP